MRTDTANFSDANSGLAKSPRYTIEIAFDDAYTDLYYVTSHSDSATPAAVTIIPSVIEGLSVTSQEIRPEDAIATIGRISFTLADINNQIRSMQASELAFGSGLKHKRIRVYMGYAGSVWADYSLIQTQIIDSVTYLDGIYTFNCADVQRLERRDIFDLARTTLAASLTSTATTVTVYDTSGNEAVKHSAYWSDAPSQTVYYIQIEDEVIRATGKTATTFTGCTRGALNTRAVEHTIDATADQDRRTEVLEYVYLEMPAPKMAYALMTGVLYNDSANLPTSWHLGISTDYVRLSDFTGIGPDLWDLSDEAVAAVRRFSGEVKQDGKQFIEEELNLSSACFNIVYATGELGLKRMTHVISDAAHVLELNASNVAAYGSLTHDMPAVKNHLEFLWNWEPAKDKYTRKNVLLDSASIALNKQSKPATVKFRGIHGEVHTAATITQIFDSLRDRFSDPPLRIDVDVLFTNNVIEVGDIVKLTLDQVMDYNTDASLDRSFEVQRTAIDWINGTVKLSLFGSAARAGTILRATTTSVLGATYYTQRGNDLKTYVGGGYDAATDYLTNSIITSCQLTGGSDLTNSLYMYYHDGDLTIDAGVTVSITENVQLLVKGFLTINGTIDGAGASNISSGVSGYIGSSQAQGGTYLRAGLRPPRDHIKYSFAQPVYAGINAAIPELALSYDSATDVLRGLPTDIRGSRGGSGGDSLWNGGTLATGGASGLSGAGLLMINQGLGFGVSGKIDLSGTSGASGGASHVPNGSMDRYIAAGGGAGGCAGGLHIILDGVDALATFDDTNIILCKGSVPNRYPPVNSPGELYETQVGIFVSSYYRGLNNGCQFESQHRVQYLLPEESAVPDIILLPSPAALAAASGTAHLLLNLDGTITPRVLLTWTAAIHEEITGYEVQFKASADSIWINSVNVLGADSAQTYVYGAKSGVDHDFRIRSAAADGTRSDWLAISNHTVIGKTEPPAQVTGFTDIFNNGNYALTWDANTETDIASYKLYLGGVEFANVKTTAYVLANLVSGTNTYTIKAVDTSGNLSTIAAEKSIVIIVPAISAPTIASGTIHLVVNLDGSINTRALVSWSVAGDEIGYELRYKLSADSAYVYINTTATSLYLNNLLDGNNYDIDIRTVGNIFNTYSSWVTSTHTVVGKTEPPANVTGFVVYQNGTSLVMKWNPNTDLDLNGYEIRILDSAGSGLWADGEVLNTSTKGTNITTVDVRDGEWLFMIKAIDTTGNYSTTEASITVAFASSFDIIDYTQFAPFTTGTLTNMVAHHTGKLVPDSQDLASVGGWAVFDETVPNPVVLCYYEGTEFDNGFDTAIRSSAIIVWYPAPILPSSPAPQFQIDYRLAAGSYDGFEDWTSGTVSFRYLKARVEVDTSIGIPILTQFTRVLDSIERTEKAENVAISASGTTVTYADPFSLVPFVTVLPISTSAITATVSAKTTTNFKIHLFNSAGTAVAGTVDWSAIGV